ncbi:HET-domain-containing protein [Trametes cingulata]|nr:HET-domain-containing protein [Trametes cingulata]
MWLLNTKTYELRFFTYPPRSYAILSHCWEEDEVTFADIQDLARARKRRGWKKVENACAAARRYKSSRERPLAWIWIDTCCIDKSSSAELSEAINAMFGWYQEAWICLAFLSDVRADEDPLTAGSSFRRSRWFTRGWTLQELIAPHAEMVFLAKDWTAIGDRDTMVGLLEDITSVGRAVLSNTAGGRLKAIQATSVAQRMAWAATRETTRPEDRAYSLMGIFQVNMPIIYGETGKRAFRRLQLEIIRQSPDHTIFAYGVPMYNLPPPAQIPCDDAMMMSFLPWWPKDFRFSGNLETLPMNALARIVGVPEVQEPHYQDTNYGIRIQLPLACVDPLRGLYCALLGVRCKSRPGDLVGLLLKRHDDTDVYRRLDYSIIFLPGDASRRRIVGADGDDASSQTALESDAHQFRWQTRAIYVLVQDNVHSITGL